MALNYSSMANWYIPIGSNRQEKIDFENFICTWQFPRLHWYCNYLPTQLLRRIIYPFSMDRDTYNKFAAHFTSKNQSQLRSYTIRYLSALALCHKQPRVRLRFAGDHSSELRETWVAPEIKLHLDSTKKYLMFAKMDEAKH